MQTFKYEVSFRVHHPFMDPEIIGRKLGLKPHHQWKAGTGRRTPKGTLLKGVYETSYCTFRLRHAKSMRLADFLKAQNKNLYRNRRMLKSIRSTGGRMEYFIGWFSTKDTGETFDVDLFKQLVDLGIDLSLAVYGSESSDVL